MFKLGSGVFEFQKYWLDVTRQYLQFINPTDAQ